MRRKRVTKFFALLIVATMIAAACGGGEQPAEEQEAQQGGTYRVQTDEFAWTNAFDPTGEYLGTAFAIYTNLLLRTLVSYRHVAGDEGNEIVPDLAEELPKVSEDGLEYTFTIKEGVTFGPPLDRQITSADVEYAFRRIDWSAAGAQYGSYYDGTIVGMDGPQEQLPEDIEGIETPDDRTVIFRLQKPTGDFLFRLAMPAAAPLPEEVAGCFNKAGDYGRFLVASGPYMIEGSDQQDASSCDTLEPLEGIDVQNFLRLERNPSYDPDTDSPEYRENNIDRFEMTLNTNTQDIFDKIEAGEVEGEVAAPPAPVLRDYSQNEELQDRLKSEAGDRTWYITLNLTQPPFDDINVRKAANFVMDKNAIQRVWGGPLRGEIATHIMPDGMLEGRLDDYDPYPSEEFAGDEEAAKEAMSESKYDTDGDGLCDAPQCKNVLHVTRNIPPQSDMGPIVEDSLAKIGITLNTRESADFYEEIQTTSNNVPISSVPGWGKDYADPFTFAVLFSTDFILAEGNVNYSLVGVTPQIAQGKDLGLTGNLTGVPGVDDQIDECFELTEDERLDCWAEFDQTVMEDVVPWVPYLDATNIDIIGPAVSQYEYDQFSGEAAFSKVAVDESQQQGL